MFSCGETGLIARYCRSHVQRHYPKKYGICQSRSGKNPLMAAGEQPAAVKLDKTYDTDDVEKMRDIMVRTGN